MIAVVVPTIRQESFEKFMVAWQGLFSEYGVRLIVIHDGENPILDDYQGGTSTLSEIMGKNADLVFNKNDGVRNLGFYYIAKHMPDVEYIITLDDDVEPCGDTIYDHIKALNQKVPTTWMNTAQYVYVRGFPYGVREESEVVLSHGIWHGVPDLDAPTQLVKGTDSLEFVETTIPKGVFYPMCGMNLAFKRKMLPYMYFAPMGEKAGLDRFADIWCGIESKKVIDRNNWAVVSGHSHVTHKRASNVFTNLKKEAKGIELNEDFYKNTTVKNEAYFKMYKEKRQKWEKIMLSYLKGGDTK